MKRYKVTYTIKKDNNFIIDSTVVGCQDWEDSWDAMNAVENYIENCLADSAEELK